MNILHNEAVSVLDRRERVSVLIALIQDGERAIAETQRIVGIATDVLYKEMQELNK